MKGSPYKGLVPYTEDDAAYFFGRDAESEIIGANLKASPLTVLYGASGVGKSSVIRAGVVKQVNGAAREQIRRKRRPAFIAIYCQDWRDNPAGSVAEAVKRALASLDIAVQSGGSDDMYSLLSANADAAEGRLILILDQFEEYLFYHVRGDAANRFDDAVATIVNDASLRVNVMISLRDDALSRLDHYKGLIHSVFNNYLRIDHMDFKSARDAVLKPVPIFCRENGLPEIRVEEELLTAVLEQVQIGQLSFGDLAPIEKDGEPRIQAPYLQLVMTRLWDEEQQLKSSSLRRETLRKLGESKAIVGNHLDGTMNEFSPEERETAERVFFHLVTPSGTKIAHNIADLEAFTGVPAPRIADVISKLADPRHRILRTVPPLNNLVGAPRYEIYHDALAEAILAWQHRFRAEMEKKALERKLREEENRRRETEKNRRVRFLLVLTSVGIVIFSLITLFALRAQRAAVAARAEAESARVLEGRQRAEAEQARALAAQRLELFKKGVLIRQAALSGNQDAVASLVNSLQKSPIMFKASKTYLGYKNPSGQDVFQFKLFPDPATLPKPADSIASVTYLANHPTFQNNLLIAGANREFTASYIGWGCLNSIVAVTEYTDPDRMPTVNEFDMCAQINR